MSVKMGDSYKGLCIGGPRDGQFLIYSGPIYQVVVPSRPFTIYQESPDMVFTAVHHCYKFEPINVGEVNAGLWIYESLSLTSAFEQLFAAYAQKAKS